MDFTWDPGALSASPMFQSLWPVLRACPAAGFPVTADLDALARELGIRNANGTAITFVADENSRRREPDSQYEVRVYREGTVPTRRANWHDLFNALAWITFPRTKAELNRRHYREIMARCGRSRRDNAGNDPGSRGTARTDIGSRGAARDVITLFDESGVIVACAEPELAQLLREFRWKDLFWSERARVHQAIRFFVFGHALLEKGMRPYKGLTAKALILDVPIAQFRRPLQAQLAEVDGAAARYFRSEDAIASTRTLSPLPLFGVPGWCPANEDESFYDDASVFRPGRIRGR